MITHKIMEDIQMNESIKDRFLKEHALNDDELDKVVGGALELGKDYEVGIPCTCPKCGGPAQAMLDLHTGEYFDISCYYGCYTM